MALEDLNPAVRVEEILDGADIEPATRLEYFMKKAANEVPKPAGSSDAGKVVTVNEDGDGYELGEAGGGSGLPEYSLSDADKVLTVAEDAEHGSSVDAVPQQTVTTSSGQASLSNVLSDAFVGGRSGVMTINGTDYNVTVVDFGVYQGVFYPDADNRTYSIYMNGEFDATSEDGDYSVSLTLSVPGVTAEWKSVVNFIMIDSVSSEYTATNAADFAIIDNGTELATENAVREYLSKLKNKVCFVKFVDHWNNSAVFPVVYIGNNYVEFIDCGSPSIQVFRNAGFVLRSGD